MKKSYKFLSLLLSLVLIISMSNSRLYAQETTRTNFLSSDELSFSVLSDESDSIVLEMYSDYMDYDKVQYEATINNSNDHIKIDIVGYENDNELFREPFDMDLNTIQSYDKSITIESFSASDFINLIIAIYDNEYETNTKLIQESPCTSDSNLVSDDMLSTASYAAYFGESALLLEGCLGIGLLTLIIANWEIIVAVLIVALVAYTAYQLYKYLKAQYQEQDMKITKSCAKHLEGTAVASMVKKKLPVEVYWSPSENEALLVYEFDNGFRAGVNEYMYTNSTTSLSYDFPNFNLTGFKLLILVDFTEEKIHHAEVRYGEYADKQIEYLRYKNAMTMQLVPDYKYDQKYENGSTKRITNKQTAK